MTRDRRSADLVALPGDKTAPSERRPVVAAARSVAKSLDSLMSDQRSQSTSWLPIHTAGPSIAPTILEFVTGNSATCSGRRNFALLYLALQWIAVPLGVTDRLRAMTEQATERWKVNTQGGKAIAAAWPEIWEQAEAATKVREQVETRETSNGE